jgi:hypothetical protein
MEVLRNLFGSLSSGLIRLAVAVGIIAAVGIFLLKPALDSADHAVDRSSEASEKIFNNSDDGVNTGLSQISKALEQVNNQVKVQVHRSFHVVKTQGGPQEPKKLIRCIHRANGDVHRIQRCARKY